MHLTQDYDGFKTRGYFKAALVCKWLSAIFVFAGSLYTHPLKY